MTTPRLPWRRRLEARVAAGVTLLVAASLAAIVVATTRAVTERALERTSDDLDAARVAFGRLATDRADFAAAQSALVAELPVFRAHLSDRRLAGDPATLEAMADHYRDQLDAAFAIVSDQSGGWIASSAWPAGGDPSTLAPVIADATAGAPARAVVPAGGGLFLVLSAPAAFAGEVLGTLTAGYALDDRFARSLAEVTHREVNLVGPGGMYASSLAPADRPALAEALAGAAERLPADRPVVRVGAGEYVAGVFPLTFGHADGLATLVLLDDWGPTQAFLNRLRQRLLAAGLVIFAIALGMGLFFSRRLTKPLEDLAEAARDIAAGNWTRQLPVRGTAEEAVTAEAVNTMTTGLRHWYEEAKARDDQLRQAQKLDALGRLAGGVAHDFNNILTAITGYAELILEGMDPGDARRSRAKGILKAAETAAGLTRQLLAFSRQRATVSRVVSLERLLPAAEKMLRRLIGEEIELRTVLAPGVGCVHGDPHQIEQVLLNLVVNARDAMPGGGRVDVELAEVSLPAPDGPANLDAGVWIRLSVRDSGCGIAPEVQARMFEPFFTTKPDGAGTGLGLSVVYGIVEQMGGAIVVDTAPGRGTTFHIYLPRTLEKEAGGDASQAAPSSCAGTVLLVEDELQVADLVATALQKRGYQVLRAARGAEALEMLGGHVGTIDLLLTDVVMPEMSGRELANRVLALRPGMSVLYMSGYQDDALRQRGVDTAKAHFIAKPFSINVLAARIQDIIAPPARAVA